MSRNGARERHVCVRYETRERLPDMRYLVGLVRSRCELRTLVLRELRTDPARWGGLLLARPTIVRRRGLRRVGFLDGCDELVGVLSPESDRFRCQDRHVTELHDFHH